MQVVKSGPDQGWSWVVVSAAFFCSLVLAGIFRTSGVLFVAFIATFGVKREEAAWPMALCIAILNLTGPFAGILGQRYGVRPVVITGAVIGTIGVATCYLTTSLTVISVLFGGIFGFGYGLVNTLMPVIVNAYFLNLRGTANGIANSGSCFGSVILPVLFEYLISNYGLSGCFLLTGGIVLNVAVAGALMRPPPWINPKRRISKELLSESPNKEGPTSLISPRKPSINRTVIDVPKSKKCSIEEDTREVFAPLDPGSDPHRDLQAELVNALNKRTMFQTTELTDFAEESYASLDTSSSSVFERKDSNLDGLQLELRRAEKEFEDTLSDFQSVAIDIVETSKSEEILNRVDPDEVKTSDLTDSCPARHSFSVSSAKRGRGKFKSQIPSSGPLKKYSFKLRNSSGDSDLSPVSEGMDVLSKERSSSHQELMQTLEESTGGPPGVVAKDTRTALKPDDKILEETTDGTKQLTAFGSFAKVLTSAMFFVTATTNVTFYFIFHMYVVIVVDYSLDQGVAEQDTKYILFAFAMSDLFGRLCFGWVTDRKFLSRSRFVMTGMVGIGLVLFAFPFATDYYSLVVVSCCYGVLLGCSMVIFPILLLDYLGSEVLAVAYGCMCFMNGFTSFLRPIIIGYFRDNIGSYHNMFYILGSMSIIASALWILEKCFHPKLRPPTHYEPMTERHQSR